MFEVDSWNRRGIERFLLERRGGKVELRSRLDQNGVHGGLLRGLGGGLYELAIYRKKKKGGIFSGDCGVQSSEGGRIGARLLGKHLERGKRGKGISMDKRRRLARCERSGGTVGIREREENKLMLPVIG